MIEIHKEKNKYWLRKENFQKFKGVIEGITKVELIRLSEEIKKILYENYKRK